MRKKMSLLLLIFILFFISCKNNVEHESNVFNPILKEKIREMLSLQKNKTKYGNNDYKVCNVVILRDNKNDECIAIIALGSSIIQNSKQFIISSDSIKNQTELKISGYTFLDNEIIGCCILANTCNNMLVDEKGLIPFGDSIPGYKGIMNFDPNVNFDAPLKIYKIISSDSLQLIESFFIN